MNERLLCRLEYMVINARLGMIASSIPDYTAQISALDLWSCVLLHLIFRRVLSLVCAVIVEYEGNMKHSAYSCTVLSVT